MNSILGNTVTDVYTLLYCIFMVHAYYSKEKGQTLKEL